MTRPCSASVLTVFLLFVSLVSGCGDEGKSEIWGIDRDEFFSKLRSGDREFLEALDFTRLRLDEVYRAGDGAGLYMAMVLDRPGYGEQVKKLLELELGRGKGVRRKEAGELLVKKYFEESDYKAAERLLETLVGRYPDDQDLRRRLIESRYRRQKDEEVLANLSDLRKKKQPLGSAGYPEEELLLWEAVSESRLNKAGWENRFRTLFLEYPASNIHARAWEFIGLAESRKARFHEDELSAFAGKARTWTREYGNAASQFDKVLVSDSSMIRSAWMLREAGRAFQGAGRSAEGAERISALIPFLDGDALFAAEETAGRLYRAAEKYDEADRYLAQSLTHATDADGFDRALWYRMSAQIRKSPEKAADSVGRYASMWHRPEYFSDLFDELCTSYVAGSRWDLLWKVFQTVEKTGPKSAASQYAVVLAAVIRAGRFSIPGEAPGASAERLYRTAMTGGSLYYRFLAAASLGESLNLEHSPDTPDDAMPGAEPAAGEKDDGDADTPVMPPGKKPLIKPDPGLVEHIRGCFEFGLYAEGASILERNMAAVTPESALDLARGLYAGGRHMEALRLMAKLYDTERTPVTKEALELLFPRAYGEQIEPLSEKEKYPASFLYGLVKEESYFNPKAKSGAGAVGLSQLVPDTAKDVGSRIGIRNPVLTDPETNLRIGARYLGLLLERFRYPLYALAGYNAGYGRIRTWIDLWGHLPFEVFAERLPYAETRMYIHKVVTAAVLYAYLYEETDMRDGVAFFFPWIRLR